MENIRNHAAWARLDPYKEAIDRVNKPAIDAGYGEQLARHKEVHRWLSELRAYYNKHPRVSINQLNEVVPLLDTLTNTLGTYPDPSQALLQAEATLETMIVYLGRMGQPQATRSNGKLDEVTSMLISDLEERARELQVARTSDQQAAEAWEGEARENLARYEAEVDSRAVEFEEQLTKTREALDAERARIDTLVRDSADRIDESAKEILGRIEKAAERAGVLEQVIANKATASHYAQWARKERKSFLTMNAIGLVLALGGFVLLLPSINALAAGGQVSWQLVALRVVGSVTLGALATYSFGVARNHRREEVRAKNRELALAALPGVLHEVDESQRQEIFMRLGDQLVSEDRGAVNDEAHSSGVSPQATIDQLLQIISRKI